MTDGSAVIPIASLDKQKDILSDIEAQWHNQMDLSLETEMSINEWSDRVRGFVQAAHAFARAGNPLEEYKCWAELAAAAASRMVIVEASIPEA